MRELNKMPVSWRFVPGCGPISWTEWWDDPILKGRRQGLKGPELFGGFYMSGDRLAE